MRDQRNLPWHRRGATWLLRQLRGRRGQKWRRDHPRLRAEGKATEHRVSLGLKSATRRALLGGTVALSVATVADALAPIQVATLNVGYSDVAEAEILSSSYVLDPDTTSGASVDIDGSGWVLRLRVPKQPSGLPVQSCVQVDRSDAGGSDASTSCFWRTTERPLGLLNRPASPSTSGSGNVMLTKDAGNGLVDLYVTMPSDYWPDTIMHGVRIDGGFWGNVKPGRVRTVINSSNWAHEDPIYGFVNIPHERASSSTLNLELWVTHVTARRGRGVAGVRLWALDTNGHTTPIVASSITALSSIQTVGSITEVFKVALDLTNLDNVTTAEEICQVDGIVQPWVGPAYQISVGGVAWPTPLPCTPHRFVNDKAGTYGGAVVYIAPTAGASPAVSLGPAANKTAAYAQAWGAAQILTALAAAQTWNNASSAGHSVLHANVGGVEVRFLDSAGTADQSYELSGNITQTAGACWCIFRNAPENTFRGYYNQAGPTGSLRNVPSLMMFSLDIVKNGTAGVFSCNDTSVNNAKMIAVNGAAVSLLAGTSAPYVRNVGLAYQYNINFDHGASGTQVPGLGTEGTSGLRCAKAIGILMGSSGTPGAQAATVFPYMAIGITGRVILSNGNATQQTTNDGGIVDCWKSFANAGAMDVFTGTWDYTRGFAFMQSVFEWVTLNDLGLGSGSRTKQLKNFLVAYLTVPGDPADLNATIGRINGYYNDVSVCRGHTARGLWKYCASGLEASKSAYFSYNNSGGIAGNVGNYPIVYGVNRAGNILASNRIVTPDGTDYWCMAADAKSAGNVGLIPFKGSLAGNGAAGWGDYRLQGPTNPCYDRVANDNELRAYAIDGNPRDGTAGAFSKAA